jgi:hypothetical protein
MFNVDCSIEHRELRIEHSLEIRDTLNKERTLGDFATNRYESCGLGSGQAVLHCAHPLVLSSPVQCPAKQGCEELLTAAVERGPLILYREWADYPSLRASDEHRPIVRVLRARRMVWLFPAFH